jgi:hypothetical protein
MLLNNRNNINENDFKSFVLLSQQWKEVSLQNNLNITDNESVRIVKNKIANGLLEILDGL